MKQKIVVCLLIIAAFFQNSNLQAQNGWNKTYPLGEKAALKGVIETSDSGYIMPLAIGNKIPLIIKINQLGNIVWQYSPSNFVSDVAGPNIVQTKEKDYIIFFTNNSSTGILSGVIAIKIDKNGVEIWRKAITSGFCETAKMDTSNNQIILAMANISPYNAGHLITITPEGNIVSDYSYNAISFHSIEIGGDGFVYASVSDGNTINTRPYSGIIKIDNNTGNIIWKNEYPVDSNSEISRFRYAGRVKQTTDGRILLNNNTKFDYDGRVLFSQNPSSRNSVFTTKKNESNTYGIFYDVPFSYAENTSYFVKKDSVGNILSKRLIEYGGGVFYDMISTLDGGFLTVGYDANSHAHAIKLNAEGLVYTNLLKGKINIDSIQNCSIDSQERGFSERIISLEQANNTRYTKTDSIGNYEIQVDTGNYTVRGILPNTNWRFCPPSVSKRFSAFGVMDTMNFAAQAAYYCPQMKVSSSLSGLRRCFDNNNYYIRYTNEGTKTAQNAYITLKLDSLLEYISATRPLSSRQGQTLRFDLGTVPIGFDDQFSVQVRVKCGDSTRLGQSLCTEARIFPDTICVPAPNWSGANIVVNGRCDRDSVRFLIQNIGTATSVPLRRKIVEDEIVFLNGLISVPANGSQTISVPANGKTWQLLVEQEPNNPLSNHPTAVVEGCRTSPNIPISTGFVNQFPTDDGSPTIDNVCAQIVGSFDPNDKEGLPLGYKTAHFIDQNQDIEYRIRFQNTGTDTAFTIVVRDTLSDFLDIASLKIGASSHRFNWTIDGKNVLVFRFENILLPDSFRNEAASHGFVKFKISQKKDVVLGTKIMNQADIYFDYNAPIRTNKTVHTIGKDFIITALQTISPIPNVEIKVYPNPFNAEATIEIQGFDPLSKTSNFLLFDALGRQIRHEKFEGNQFLFERQELPTGIYFFKIENGGRLVGTGKFLVK